MKMPERWRSSRIVPSLSVFLPKDLKWCHAMTSHRDITWHNMIRQSEPAKVNQSDNLKITFFNLATLTYDLGLQAHPRYCQGQSLHRILTLYIKLFSRERADRHTDRQTAGTDFIPSMLTRKGINPMIIYRRWLDIICFYGGNYAG